MKIAIFFGVILLSIVCGFASGQNIERHLKSSCLEKRTTVLDHFVDPFRVELGKCDKADDCTFFQIGSGLHWNKKFYGKYASCFRHAAAMSWHFCKEENSKSKTQGLSGEGSGAPIGLIPYAYACINHSCTALEKDSDEFLKNRSVIYSGYKGSNDVNKEFIDRCISKVEATFPKLLKSDK